LQLSVIGKFRDGRLIYAVPPHTPPYGYIAIGVIDRGTNVLQVRPTTICPQNCIFCSVDAGLHSRNRWAEFIVDPEVIVRGVEEAISVKGCYVEALIDTVGDPLTYPYLVELVKALKSISGVKSVALETHGMLLSRRLVDKLHNAGLDRVNLSLETLNSEKARFLYGTRAYSVERVVDVAEYLVSETNIDLHVTPLWLPGINDRDVERVLEWALRVGAGKKWPPVTVQKFTKHKYGRGHNLREASWSEFWRFVESLEKKIGVKLRWSMEEWGMHYARSVKPPISRGDLVEVNIVSRGWLKREYLGVYSDKYLIGVFTSGHLGNIVNRKALIRVINDKNGLLLGVVEKAYSSSNYLLA
jgi:uncharacterized Fe-S cluster-containing radical SAM superfamily enzyme